MGILLQENLLDIVKLSISALCTLVGFLEELQRDFNTMIIWIVLLNLQLYDEKVLFFNKVMFNKVLDVFFTTMEIEGSI